MDTQELSNSILSAIEKDKVILFNQDPLMVEAVKKYILAVVYKQGVINAGQEHNSRINWAMNLAWGATDGKGMPRTDKELGQNLRAMTSAVQLIESGFKELLEIKKPEPEKEINHNEAE